MIHPAGFRPAWWLPGPHAQTLWPHLFRRPRRPPTRRERLELPDGDFVDLDWTPREDGPLVAVFHGLEGSIDSSYASGVLGALHEAGLRAVLMHFRGCSGEPNRLPRGYHSGDTGDIRHLLGVLRGRFPDTPLGAVGYSLGGNALLCTLGEDGADAPLQAAAAVSVPLVLREAADRLKRGFSRVYGAHLLRSLKASAAARLTGRDDHPVDLAAVQASRDFWELDDRLTAPLHGFADVHDYYARSASRQHLGAVRVPTLVVHSADDPFLTPAVIPEPHELSDAVRFELSRAGGHVGFVSGRIPLRPRYWLDERLVAWFSEKLRSDLPPT
ncbi:MAG: hydrolase [Alphaproteobacteria bacterium]|nr:hydrolase [Alphaproteobacteria bacterium]